MKPAPALLAIIGPTATGKTSLAIEVARALDGEIISMDSRQVYRGTDIGTAKATPEQRRAVPHHGLDLVEPEERFSAGKFARYAREKIGEIRSRGRAPILVGGTGFFLRALTNPIFAEPDFDPGRRAAVADFLDSFDDSTLRRWLGILDPVSAARLREWGGRQRLLRALEMPLLTGRPLSWWQAHGPAEAEALHPLVFALHLPRAELYARIDARVTAMVEHGLLEEVTSLVHAGYNENSPGLKSTGYMELFPYLRGEIGLDEALHEIRRNTRAYARRQATWIRNQLPAGTVHLDASRPLAELAREVVERVQMVGAAPGPAGRNPTGESNGESNAEGAP